jgi:hypothetical protein
MEYGPWPKPHFIPRVKAKVELKLSIPIGAMTEISYKGFILGVKVENEIYH